MSTVLLWLLLLVPTRPPGNHHERPYDDCRLINCLRPVATAEGYCYRHRSWPNFPPGS